VNSAQLDKWTEDFEAEEDRRKREAAAALAEEGWTVVKRRGVCPTPWLAASEAVWDTMHVQAVVSWVSTCCFYVMC
jgi:hypothetical protein